MVAQVHSDWNLISKELIRWLKLSRDTNAKHALLFATRTCNKLAGG
jgi:hypothetical protein